MMLFLNAWSNSWPWDGCRCFFYRRNIAQVTPKIIYFYYLIKIFSGSKYPKNVLFNFEKRSTDGYCTVGSLDIARGHLWQPTHSLGCGTKNNTPAGQWDFFYRDIGYGTLKISHFHYLQNKTLDQSVSASFFKIK